MIRTASLWLAWVILMIPVNLFLIVMVLSTFAESLFLEWADGVFQKIGRKA